MEHLPSTEQEKQLQAAEVVAEVMVRALPLSSFNPENPRARDFREKMGITELQFGEYTDGQSRVVVCDDTLQKSGSFKSRGSANALLCTEAGTITAASAGNHGNGVAIAGKLLGKQVVVEVPSGASSVKLDNMRTNGAEVHAVHATVDAAVPAAQASGRRENAQFIHPYDNYDVIAGQATVGFEMLEQLLADQEAERLDLASDRVEVFVPIGGGGLITGVASVFYWAKQTGLVGENVVVRGVQMEGCDAMNRIVQGCRLPGTGGLFADGEFNPTCDGTAVKKVGELTRTVVADTCFVQDIVTVSEAQLGAAMRSLESLQNKRIEPAGALSMAGTEKAMCAAGFDDITYYTISSGCNVSPETWRYFTQEVLARRERACSVVSGLVIRQMEQPLQQDESTNTPHDVINKYYDSLEASGIYLQRRY